MQELKIAHRVRIYLCEDDSWHHRPADRAILDLLRQEGAIGATVFKGIEGFGSGGQLHTTALVDLATSLPLVIEWVDAPELVQRLLPHITPMVSGLITVEEIRVAKAPARAIRDVSATVSVADAMTPAARVDKVSPDTSLPELVNVLLNNRRNAIPVVDKDDHVVGIITNRDLVQRAGLPLRLELLRALGEPTQPAVAAQLAGLQGEGRTAATIMTAHPITIGPDVPLPEAASMMLQRRLKRLPVVDGDGRLLGMLSRFDVLKTAAGGYRHPDLAETGETKRNGRAPRRIGEVMNRRVPTVAADAPLPEVVDAVMATRLHRAVVVDNDRRPIGGIVDTDLMQRVTPSAHPSLAQALMRRVKATSPAEREAWRQRTGQRAADVMRPRDRLLVVPENAEITDVIDNSLTQGIKLVVVVDNEGHVIGMADRADLLAALTITG